MIITRKKIKVESSYHGHVHGSENFRRHNTVDNWCTSNEKRETIKNPWLWVLVGKILIWITHSVIIGAIQWRRKEIFHDGKIKQGGLQVSNLTVYLVSQMSSTVQSAQSTGSAFIHVRTQRISGQACCWRWQRCCNHEILNHQDT